MEFGALRVSRRWLALLLLIAAYCVASPVEGFIYKPIASALGLHMIVRGEMVLAPYAILMTVRLIVNLLIVAAILAILDIRPALSPLRSQNIRALLCAGFLTGFLVMSAVLLAIVGTGSAALTGSGQSVTQAVSHCLGWLPFDFLGTTGEELFGRVALLVVAERFVGKPGAALASGGLFFVDHLGNP